MRSWSSAVICLACSLGTWECCSTFVQNKGINVTERKRKGCFFFLCGLIPTNVPYTRGRRWTETTKWCFQWIWWLLCMLLIADQRCLNCCFVVASWMLRQWKCSPRQHQGITQQLWLTKDSLVTLDSEIVSN